MKYSRISLWNSIAFKQSYHQVFTNFYFIITGANENNQIRTPLTEWEQFSVKCTVETVKHTDFKYNISMQMIVTHICVLTSFTYQC